MLSIELNPNYNDGSYLGLLNNYKNSNDFICDIMEIIMVLDNKILGRADT